MKKKEEKKVDKSKIETRVKMMKKKKKKEIDWRK